MKYGWHKHRKCLNIVFYIESLEHCKNNNIEITDESQALETLGYECMSKYG
jgi:hypothetical protein